MTPEEAENDAYYLSHYDHGYVFWEDGSRDEFGLSSVTPKEMEKYNSLSGCLEALAREWYPEKASMEIDKVSIAR